MLCFHFGSHTCPASLRWTWHRVNRCSWPQQCPPVHLSFGREQKPVAVFDASVTSYADLCCSKQFGGYSSAHFGVRKPRSLAPTGSNLVLAGALSRYFEYSDCFPNHISLVDFEHLALKIDRHFIDFPIFGGIDSGFTAASLSGYCLRHHSSGH